MMEYNSITTLNEIREHSPCEDGWKKLLAYLGKTKADDEPLHLLTILESNGLDDAIWCLRAKSLDRLSRHFQAWCAEQVLHLFEAERPNDTRVRDQIAMLRNDDARAAARYAAWGAARAAARDAEGAAARSAARFAAKAAAEVAGDAAKAAVRDASWYAADVAAWYAVRYAACGAVRSAAGYAAWDAAWDAAWNTAWDAQEKQLRAMIAAQQGGEK